MPKEKTAAAKRPPHEAIAPPKRAPVRPLGDLAAPLDVSKQALYPAAEKGYIGGVIRTGKHWKIRNEAFDYHAARGYGAGIAPWGSPEAVRVGEIATADSTA